MNLDTTLDTVNFLDLPPLAVDPHPDLNHVVPQNRGFPPAGIMGILSGPLPITRAALIILAHLLGAVRRKPVAIGAFFTWLRVWSFFVMAMGFFFAGVFFGLAIVWLLRVGRPRRARRALYQAFPPQKSAC